MTLGESLLSPGSGLLLSNKAGSRRWELLTALREGSRGCSPPSLQVLSCVGQWLALGLWQEEGDSAGSHRGHSLDQGCQTHFHRGPHQPCGSLPRAECNFRTV